MKRQHKVVTVCLKAPVAFWSRILGVRSDTIRKRLLAGWEAHAAVATPSREGHPKRWPKGRNVGH